MQLIWLDQRGQGVTFVDKALQAQRGGASALIIANHLADPWPFVMRSSAETKQDVTIPVVMVSKADGQALRQLVADSASKDDAIACQLVIERVSPDCAVCCEPFACQSDKTAKPVLQLEPYCGHVFHEECAMAWLTKHNTCPYCRRIMPTDDADFNAQQQRQQQRESSSGTAAGDGTSSEWSDFYG